MAEERSKGLVIAVDGPAASGKGTVAREVARRLGYLYLDTGAMYRAVAWRALQTETPLADLDRVVALAQETRIELEAGEGEMRVWVEGQDVTEALREPEVSQASSRIAVIPELRNVLVAQQQRLGREGGVVMEGRDIGSVVFPDAEVKIYLDASPEVRAERRRAQLAQSGVEVSFQRMLAEIHERDKRDRERSAAPMGRAPEAIYIDSTALTIEEVVAAIVEIASRRGRKDTSS